MAYANQPRTFFGQIAAVQDFVLDLLPNAQPPVNGWGAALDAMHSGAHPAME